VSFANVHLVKKREYYINPTTNWPFEKIRKITYKKTPTFLLHTKNTHFSFTYKKWSDLHRNFSNHSWV